MAGRRRFGGLRKLTSGRYQASYLAPDGCRRAAPHTFRTKTEAERWLALLEAEMVRGDWVDPERSRITVEEFGERWIRQRPGLRPRRADLYRWLFKRYIADHLGRVKLGEVTPAVVRRWHHDLTEAGVSATMTEKAYRVLRAILTTAVDDGVLTRNPCRIRGAGNEPTPERPVLTVGQVFALAAAMPERYRALVVVATFGSLRWSEAVALRRIDVDVENGVLWVRVAFAERSTGELVPSPPKSRAGVRAVRLPGPVVTLLKAHVTKYTGDAPEALVFTAEKGGPLRRSNFNRIVGWPGAVKALGVQGLHFHDLRHTGNTLAVGTAASLRDLMDRTGHDSMRAALIYQHATNGADRRIAEALAKYIEACPDDGDGAPDPAA
jgi:integrase